MGEVESKSEQQQLASGARVEWQRLKDAFKQYCCAINKISHKHGFECEDLDAYRFRINRGSDATTILSLIFDPTTPRVLFRQAHSAHDELGFKLVGTQAMLMNGSSGVVIPEFVAHFLMQALRQS